MNKGNRFDSTEINIIHEPFQGSDEWLALRRTKITATDARVLMGVDPWKTKQELYKEKMGEGKPRYVNKHMQWGLDNEDRILENCSIKYGVKLSKCTVVRDWALASMDGLNDEADFAVEIKCPGPTDHSKALNGQIPLKYWPQLQFQMYVCGLRSIFYESSIDGEDSVEVLVRRDDEYIKDMIEKCLKFYECIQNKTPPEYDEGSFIERDDLLWKEYTDEYKRIQLQLKELEMEEKRVRNHLIYLSMSHNSKGNGVTLQKVSRKGNIDYSRIEVLKEIDLEQFRTDTTSSWRITTQ
jgi:putative phage-type endonuclease